MESPNILITESGWTKCFCGHEEEEEDFQISDYVSLPMIWCSGCEGRIFLDAPMIPDPNYGNYDEEDIAFGRKTLWSAITPRLPLDIDYSRLERVGYRGDEIIYRVKPCWVNRVLGSNVRHYAENLSEEQIAELKARFVGEKHFLTNILREGKKNFSEETLSITNSFGLKKICWEGDVLEEKHMTFSEPCESYDVDEPKITYPGWMDTAHDGISVICSVIYQGRPTIARYWGD